MKADARAAGLSISDLLIKNRGTASPSPEILVRHVETICGIETHLAAIVRQIGTTEPACWHRAMLKLIAIEARVAKLTDSATPG